MNEKPILPILEEVWQKTSRWHPNQYQQEQLQILYQEILIGNQVMNLTRITEPMEFWEKHLWDSLIGLLELESLTQDSLSIIDIGTGAGFPGIPTAIAFPQWQITLLDSKRKKMDFLAKIVPKLDLNNVKILVGRAEEIGNTKDHRESYDLALIRAVSDPSVCTQYALPFLKLGGVAILYRGYWNSEETLKLQPIVEKLGGKIEAIKEFITPLSHSTRTFIYLMKIKSTPAQTYSKKRR